MDNLNVPKGWHEVFTDQFIELKKLDDTSSSFFVKQIDQLAILTDSSDEDEVWLDTDVEEMSEMVRSLKWLNTSPSLNFKREINNLTIKEIMEITFGEFIDLNNLAENWYLNLPKMCAVLYRKTMVNEWGNKKFEPYSEIANNLVARSKPFEELPIQDIYGVINYFKDFKEMVVSTYKSILDTIVNDFDDAGLTPEEIRDIEREEELRKTWAWEKMIYMLTGGDPLKTEKVTDLPLIYVLNHLSMKKVLNLD